MGKSLYGKLPLTKGEGLQMLEVIKKVNKTSQQILSDYMAAVDFLEQKGLKAEFEEYIISRKRIN